MPPSARAHAARWLPRPENPAVRFREWALSHAPRPSGLVTPWGSAFLDRRPELAAVTETWNSSHEMAFGDWDNVMVKDLPEDHIAHLFYLAQNAVVKVGCDIGTARPLKHLLRCTRTKSSNLL